MTISLRTHLSCVVAMAVLLLTFAAITATPTSTDEGKRLSEYVAAGEPPVFDDPSAAVDAFKAALADSNFDALAELLGLDSAKLKTSDGVTDTFDRIRSDAARKLVVQEVDNRRLIEVGDELWPFPFPITKGEDGKWAFDTYAGIEEIINRRVGENEIEAIATARAYVEAQRDYAAEDRDGDGVLEYAQRLLSSEGQANGLYWPADETNGVSPAGDFADKAAVDKAKKGEGYFGYRFRILTRQGDNIAGGAYDYVINDNMIAGFALIAWPVMYAETGVRTFLVSHHGIVYEADLGPDTEAKVEAIKLFNPDDNWEVTID